MLGYPPGIKGYRLLDWNTMQVFISRDVIFHEGIFSFYNHTKSSIQPDHFHDISLRVIINDMVSTPQEDVQNSTPTLGDQHVDLTSHQDQQNSDTPISDSNLNDVLVPHPPSLQVAPRKSSSQHIPPHYLKEYHCNLIKSGACYTSKHFLDVVLDYQKLYVPFKDFVFYVTVNSAPQFYHIAVKSP